MAYSMRPQGAHLVVDLSGVPTRDEVEAMFRAVGTQARKPVRALIQLHVQACLNAVDTLDVIAGIAALGLAPGYRIALVFTSDAMRSSAEFAETVAANRGIPVRAFDRRDPALQWLDA